MRSGGIDELALILLGIDVTEDKVQKPAPIMNGIHSLSTQTPPAMSEEKYEEAIIAQAKKDFENGRCGGGNNTSYMALKRSYMSVAAPDRKGNILQMIRQNADLKRGNVRYLEMRDALGNLTATYDANYGWRGISTPAENRRSSKFNAIYMSTWNALKAEAQQQVKPTSSTIDTFI